MSQEIKRIWALWRQSEAMEFWITVAPLKRGNYDGYDCCWLPEESLWCTCLFFKLSIYMIFALSTMDSVDTGHPLATSALKREIMSAICMIFLHTVEHPPAVEERNYGRPLVRSWWSATVDSWRARAWDVAAHKGCIISIFNLHWHIFHFFNLDNHQHRWSLISDTISSISRDIIEQNSAKKTKTRKPQKIISGPNNSLIKSFTHQIGQSICNVCYF